jgi:WhiB family redox-sensing transcriptional regulator
MNADIQYAPAGTVPPSPLSLTPEAADRRRERDRLSRRRSRAAARELAAPPAVVVLAVPLPPDAACAAADPDLFFPPSGDEGDKAKVICRGCPIRRECYTAAAQRGEPWGIWGGVNFGVTASATSHQEAKAS